MLCSHGDRKSCCAYRKTIFQQACISELIILTLFAVSNFLDKSFNSCYSTDYRTMFCITFIVPAQFLLFAVVSWRTNLHRSLTRYFKGCSTLTKIFLRCKRNWTWPRTRIDLYVQSCMEKACEGTRTNTCTLLIRTNMSTYSYMRVRTQGNSLYVSVKYWTCSKSIQRI